MNVASLADPSLQFYLTMNEFILQPYLIFLCYPRNPGASCHVETSHSFIALAHGRSLQHSMIKLMISTRPYDIFSIGERIIVHTWFCFLILYHKVNSWMSMSVCHLSQTYSRVTALINYHWWNYAILKLVFKTLKQHVRWLIMNVSHSRKKMKNGFYWWIC